MGSTCFHIETIQNRLKSSMVQGHFGSDLRNAQQVPGPYDCWTHLPLQIGVLKLEKWNWRMWSRKSWWRVKWRFCKLYLPVWLCSVYLPMQDDGNVTHSALELCHRSFGTSSPTYRIGRRCNDSCGPPSAHGVPCRWLQQSWDCPAAMDYRRESCCWLPRKNFDCALATSYLPVAPCVRSPCWFVGQQMCYKSGSEVWARQKWSQDFETGQWCNC